MRVVPAMIEDSSATSALMRLENNEVGFTMIELLIVIAVLGILAATVIIAVGNVASSAAQASCNSDAKTVELAVAAFHDNPRNTADPNGWPTSTAQLTDPAVDDYGGPYLTTWPGAEHYTIYLGDGVTPDAGGVVTTLGEVLVGPSTATSISQSLSYDASVNPCDASDIT